MATFLRCQYASCEKLVEYSCSCFGESYYVCSSHIDYYRGLKLEQYKEEPTCLRMSEDEISIILSKSIQDSFRTSILELVRKRNEKIKQLHEKIKEVEYKISLEITNVLKLQSEYNESNKEISANKELPTLSYKMLPCLLTNLADERLLTERNIERVLKMNFKTYQQISSSMKEPSGLFSIYRNKQQVREIIIRLLGQNRSNLQARNAFNLSRTVHVSKNIQALALSSVDNKAAACGSDNNIYVWDLLTDKSIAKFRSKTAIEKKLKFSLREKHAGKVNSLMFSDCGSLLVSGGEDMNVWVWDMNRKMCARILEGHSQEIRAVAIANDFTFIASGGDDSTVIFWKNFQEAQRYKHENTVTAVAFSPNKYVLVSGSVDNSIIVWNIELGDILHLLMNHRSCVYSLHVSPCGQFICSGSNDNLVRVWDLVTGECVSTHTEHTDAVTSVKFSPCGKKVISGSFDRSVIVWRIDTKEKEACLRDQNNEIHCIDVSNYGSLIVTGGEDDMVRYWTNIGED